MSASDTRATDPQADCFAMNKPPRAFTPFAAALRPQDFIRQKPSKRAPDDN
jgi:hypothetical protein